VKSYNQNVKQSNRLVSCSGKKIPEGTGDDYKKRTTTPQM